MTPIIDLYKIKKFTLDTLFPIHCISCSKYGEWVCSDCLEKISIGIEQVCPICNKSITPDGKTCFDCKRKYSIDGILVASSYRLDKKKTFVAKLVHYYKYRFISDLSIPLGKILKKALLQSELPLPDIIIPVPLHSRRLRWRGFNQAELLSDYLSDHISPGFKIPVLEDALLRNKYTIPQMNIKNYRQRKNNIKGSFSLNKKYLKNIKGENILLVDDIATTGSTLFECAKVLKQKNAKKVYGIVLARQ
jgi:ComF family protein